MGLVLVFRKYIHLTPEPAGPYPWTSTCLHISKDACSLTVSGSSASCEQHVSLSSAFWEQSIHITR